MRAYYRVKDRLVRRLRTRQREHPPRVPAGFVTGPPDYVGVGEQKCGTTWWHALIEAHPGVTTRRGKPKELHFFRNHDAGDYSAWFPRRPGTLCGEWTPGYLSEPGTIAKLRQVAPDAKLLVLLRDPVERYVSAVTMFVHRRGLPAERIMRGAKPRGEYRRHLDGIFAEFPRDQVLVLQYEACVADPGGQLARTYQFLGLDPGPLPTHLFGVLRNVARVSRYELSGDERAELVRHYEPHVLAVADLVPDLRLDLWPNFAHLDAGVDRRYIDPGCIGRPGSPPA